MLATDFKKILIVDDDIEYAEGLAKLMPSHFQVKTAFTLKQAAEQLASYPFDCVVSDFVLAENDGFEFLEIAHALKNPPKVIFMTAFATKHIAISLLNLGAHGLLEKPFSISILMDLLEKKGNAKKTEPWQLDPATRVMSTPAGDFDLTEVEFKVASYIIAHAGRWISREELIEQVWGKATLSRNVFDTHLTNLKRKIPELRDTLKVIRGRGYLLEKER